MPSHIAIPASGHRLATPPSELEFARAVALGLSDTPRWIPSRFLYDERGSALFEEICQTPEYYPTRTEAGILASHARDIREVTGAATLIELGSGTSVKTSYLLDAYTAGGTAVSYLSVDVSPAALALAAAAIARRHPRVRFTPVPRPYQAAFPLFRAHSPCMLVFLGSNVGNFNHAESVEFWNAVSRHLAPGDFFLLGVDLVKDRATLEAAYNDAAGVTAGFTQNLFVRMNRELGADLDLDAIEHVARYNGAWRRIETVAHFRRAQLVKIRPLDLEIALDEGEQVMVEISRKFVVEDLTRYLACFDLETRAVYRDARQWFAVLLLKKRRNGDD